MSFSTNHADILYAFTQPKRQRKIAERQAKQAAKVTKGVVVTGEKKEKVML